MSNWVEPSEVLVPGNLKEQVGGHRLVARSLVRRGLSDIAMAQGFLDPARYKPSSPMELPDLDRAVDRLEKAIDAQETILVWGDFDVDGQTSTALFVSSLRNMGANVIYHIPVRAEESHGVTQTVLKRLLDKSATEVKVLLTCDTGVAAHDAVQYAQMCGIDVIVTDHHALPSHLPDAYAIVNPRMLPEGHPLEGLPGVGVAFMLVQELFIRQGAPEACEAYLDLVALGIVADVAPIQYDTRYLLQRGIAALRSPQRLGLRMIMEVAELDPKWLTEEHIGFILAPRLNAMGRLGDANPVVELLTTQDRVRANILTQQLEGLNSRRQMLTSQVYQGALSLIQKSPSLIENPVLILAQSSWPAGVIGIVASKLVERYKKPVILISISKDGYGRGSARSVEGIDITQAISSQAHLLSGYGGHRMAAGFSIESGSIPEFTRSLSREIKHTYVLPESRLELDGYLSFSELSLENVIGLERLAPFGARNPPLILASQDVRIIHQKRVGRNQEHLLLNLSDQDDERREVIWWNGTDEAEYLGLPDGIFDLAYTARSSSFKGQRDVQVEWVDFRVKHITEIVESTRKLEIVDFRREIDSTRILESLLSNEGFLVWVEAGSMDLLKATIPEEKHRLIRGRFELESSPILGIWTIPPSGDTLRRVIEIVKPFQVFLFSDDPQVDTMEEFSRRLAGLVKYSLKREEKSVSLRRLAAAMSHDILTVRFGLEWLDAQGFISIEPLDDEIVLIKPIDVRITSEIKELTVIIHKLLEETRAYREYYLRADKDSLFT